MTKIEWADNDMSPASNEKYKPMLAVIKKKQLASTRHKSQWAVLESFMSNQTGRDLSYRLKAKHPDFEFVSRKEGEKVTVYARLKEGVTE